MKIFTIGGILLLFAAGTGYLVGQLDDAADDAADDVAIAADDAAGDVVLAADDLAVRQQPAKQLSSRPPMRRQRNSCGKPWPDSRPIWRSLRFLNQ